MPWRVVNGSYTYAYTNTIADAGCGVPANGTRDFFSLTGGGNNINATDPVLQYLRWRNRVAG